MTKKGTTNAKTATVATRNKKARATKASGGNAQTTTRVRKSTQTVRSRAVRRDRPASESGRDIGDISAIERAKAQAAAARATERDALKELHQAQRLTVGEWAAVTLFLLAIVGMGYVLGRVAV